MPDKLKWVKAWFQKGENDLIAARMIIQNPDPPTDTICFHAQQCAEKYLKGYLTLHNIEVEKTHDLVSLNNRCSEIDTQFKTLAEACAKLSVYAVEARYPG
jgi:HEPN domain-containing protein